MPSVAFFLSTTAYPIDENHPSWNHPLPHHRPINGQQRDSVDTVTITYGKYFSAVARFCAADHWNRVIKAASSRMQQPVAVNDLEKVFILLEKHGAFYHPARIKVTIGERCLCFVVNVAISRRGQRVMSREVKALEYLYDQRPFGWLPKIYSYTSSQLPMFLGDWFDGFHEFHLTRQPDGDEPAIVVWDGADFPRLLSKKQTADLYRHATMILTACYDPITTSQIFPWHHAAGDFIVRIDGERLAVRLITVRDYVPLSGSAAEPADESELLEALVVFFIHLSVRMRLDRLDGVSDVVWAPDCCLAPMVAGFFQGLDLSGRMSGFPDAFPEIFGHYVNQYDAIHLLATARRITTTVFDERSEERRVIDGNLSGHIRRICQIVSTR